MIGTNILDISGVRFDTDPLSGDVQYSITGEVDMRTALSYGGLRMPQIEDEITSVSFNDCESTFHGLPIALKKKVWIEYVFFDKRGLNAFYYDDTSVAVQPSSEDDDPYYKGGIRGFIKLNKSMYFQLVGHDVGNANFGTLLPYDGSAPRKSFYYLGAQPKIEISNDASNNIKGTIKMQFIQIEGIKLNSIIPVPNSNTYNQITSQEN